MESMPENYTELINYRIDQARNTILEVEFQIEHGYLAIAVNRIYYGMFYILLALAMKNGFKTSKHRQLLGWFNKEFVKTGKVSRKSGSIVNKAFEDRTDGDYGLFIEFSKEEVIQKMEDMRLFIRELTEFISTDK
jgi:uncharacterized protein (UPF0332 family)